MKIRKGSRFVKKSFMAKKTSLVLLSLFILMILVVSSIYVFSYSGVNAAVTACSTTSITVTQTSAPIIYIDKDTTPLLNSVYVSYKLDTGGSDSF